MDNYALEHQTLLPVIEDAGRAVMRYFQEHDYTIQHKDADNPVTDADFAANRIIRAALTKKFPHDAVLSEESENSSERQRMEERLTKNRVWIIDPIDGTREFIKGRPHFAISVGLVVHGVPVLGFIHNPAQQYMLSGGMSMGLFKNGTAFTPPERFGVNPTQALPNIIVSRSEYTHGHLPHLAKWYHNLESHTMGSIAYKLALVADGTYDLTVSVKPKNEWDIAGGAALLKAARLILLDGAFNDFIFNKPQTESLGLVAGTPEACAWYRTIFS
ncbi:MAG TPA: 3'(2'),5'-bisphosphate nucleotidase CysQ [Turneriella sp.]|nr:3'(2'),5'-bisphosphate nucleotidase CysQ [Turneriella sp.]